MEEERGRGEARAEWRRKLRMCGERQKTRSRFASQMKVEDRGNRRKEERKKLRR